MSRLQIFFLTMEVNGSISESAQNKILNTHIRQKIAEIFRKRVKNTGCVLSRKVICVSRSARITCSSLNFQSKIPFNREI